jgi:alkanesulfonate monooxygenase SsuD/methylene tetrahydromethanopterin reductase-like flavin-dependent oxidoreductase (luciferase family)
MSRRAQERAGRIADGWLAQYSLETLSESGIADGLAALRDAAAAAGRPPAELDRFRIVVRVTGADRKLDLLATRLEALADAGATELVVDVDWDDDGGPARSFDLLRSAVA